MWRDLAYWQDGLTVYDAGTVDAAIVTEETEVRPVVNGIPKSRGYIAEQVTSTFSVLKFVDQTTDFTLTIPAGYKVDDVTMYNKTAAACQLSFGTTATGTQIYAGFAIASSETITMTINRMVSPVSDTTVYIHHAGAGDTWNGCTVNFYITMRKLI